MQAWRPINQARAWRVASIEGTLRIDFRLKGASEGEVIGEDFFTLIPAFERGELIPVHPFAFTDVFEGKHGRK
jgi:hypothetical protein